MADQKHVDNNKAASAPRSECIARLNDLLRQGRAANGKVFVTSGVQALGSEFMAKAQYEVAAFADF